MIRRIRIIFFRLKVMLLKVVKGNLGYAISQGLKCGNSVNVSSGTSFGSEPYLITLHDNVRLSSNIHLITHDGAVHTVNAAGLSEKHVHAYGKIEIGENSFIGVNATILPNVYIGKNCIVAAGAVVTRSVPDNSIVAGVPARVIGTTQQFAEKKIKAMPADWDEAKFSANAREYLETHIPAPPKV